MGVRMEIKCDWCRRGISVPIQYVTHGDAREYAREQGWQVRRGDHLTCGACHAMLVATKNTHDTMRIEMRVLPTKTNVGVTEVTYVSVPTVCDNTYRVKK